MKRTWLVSLLCLALCAVMAFALIACGGNGDKGNTDNGGSENGGSTSGDNNDPSGGQDTPADDTVTVTFMNGDTVVDTVKVKKGTTVEPTSKSVEAPAGKQFKSWQRDGKDFKFTIPIDADTTLTASFVNLYTIRFKASEDATDDIKTLLVVQDGYIPEAEVPEAPDRSADHLVFEKWVLAGSTETEINYDSEVISDLTYIPVYGPAKYTVTFKDADTGAVLATQIIVYGGKVERFEDPIGKKITSVKLGDDDFNYDTYTVESNIDILVTMVADTRTVTFKNEDGSTISVLTVDRGASATLPAAPKGYYWVCADLSPLANVTEDTEITLGKITTGAYKAGPSMGLDTTNIVKYESKYQIVYGNIYPDGKSPAKQKWGTILYADGQYIEFRANIAGSLTFNCQQSDTSITTQHMTLSVYIDGCKIYSIRLDAPVARGNRTVSGIPAGDHVVRFEVSDVSVDEGGTEFTNYAGINLTTIGLSQELKTYNVTIADGTNTTTETIPYGGTVTKPENDPTPPAGQTFRFWSVDGMNEYDFSQTVTADITIRAIFISEDAKTVTFQKADGTIIGTMLVNPGEDALLPRPAIESAVCWTATTEEYAKMFNVTEDRTITLGTSTFGRSGKKYSNPGNLKLESQEGYTTAEALGFDFTNWKTQDENGVWGVYQQASGASISVTCDIVKFIIQYTVAAGQSCTFEFYADGHLIRSYEVDNSTGTSDKVCTEWTVGLDPEVITAGTHTLTLKVVGEGASVQLMAINKK